MPRYLCFFSHKLLNFRREEFEAKCDIVGAGEAQTCRPSPTLPLFLGGAPPLVAFTQFYVLIWIPCIY